MTLTGVFMFFYTIHDVYMILTFGRPGLVFTTFFYCVILDNAKSLVTLSMVYCVVVRRFIYLDVNEDEIAESQEKVPKQEN